MTNQAVQQPLQAPATPPPAILTAGYYIGRLPNDTERRKVARTIGDRIMQRIKIAMQTMIKATISELDDEDFLRVIRLKPLEVWAEQRAKFPTGWAHSFDAQMERWARVAPVDPLRDAILAELERMP